MLAGLLSLSPTREPAKERPQFLHSGEDAAENLFPVEILLCACARTFSSPPFSLSHLDS